MGVLYEGSCGIDGAGCDAALLLAVFALVQIVGVVTAVLAWQSMLDRGEPHPERPLISAVLAIGSLVGVVGVWRWSGVYLLMAAMAIGVVVHLCFGDPMSSVMTRVGLSIGIAYYVNEKQAAFR